MKRINEESDSEQLQSPRLLLNLNPFRNGLKVIHVVSQCALKGSGNLVVVLQSETRRPYRTSDTPASQINWSPNPIS